MQRTSSDGSWSSRDFLLRNRFCPPSEIQDLLDLTRARMRLPWLVLIPFDFRNRLSSLFFVSAESVRDERDIRRRAQRADWPTRSATAADRLETEVFVETLLPPRLRGSSIASGPLGSHGSQQFAASDPIGVIRCWIVGPGGDRTVLDSELFEVLAEMLNGTAIAHSSRDGRVSELVTELPVAVDLAATIEGLLGLAVRVSSATSAAYYAADPRRRSLVRSSTLHLAKMPQRVFPDLIPLEGRDLAGHLSRARAAYVRSRTFIWPPEDVGHGAADDAEWGVYAAIPVPTAPVWSGGQNAGLLVIAKAHRSGAEPVAFGQSDLALLRNVALRLSLVAHLSATASSARLVIDLGRGLSARQISARSELDDIPWNASTEVPSDIDRVRDALTMLARHVFEMTGSDSVTIRVLVPVADEDGDDWVLRRFIAHPPARLHRTDGDLSVTRLDDRGRRPWRSSANVYAAVRGLHAMVWDTKFHLPVQVEGLEGLRSVSEDTRSELALPIVADGFVVGTMNLESSLPHRYTGQLDSIASFAALAGIAVSLGRGEAIRAIAERFSLIGAGYHEASAAEIMRLENQSILATGVAVDGAVGALDFPDVEDSDPDLWVSLADESVDGGKISIRDLLDAAATPGEFPVAAILENLIDPAIEVSGILAVGVREGFREICANIGASLSRAARATSGVLTLGGAEMTVLTIANQPEVEVDDLSFLQRLYRSPIPDRGGRGRPHLGCFTVGETVRGLGGNVFASVTTDGWFETRLLIPRVAA